MGRNIMSEVTQTRRMTPLSATVEVGQALAEFSYIMQYSTKYIESLVLWTKKYTFGTFDCDAFLLG